MNKKLSKQKIIHTKIANQENKIDLKYKTRNRDRQLADLESAPLNYIMSEGRCTKLLRLLSYNLNILH